MNNPRMKSPFQIGISHVFGSSLSTSGTGSGGFGSESQEEKHHQPEHLMPTNITLRTVGIGHVVIGQRGNGFELEKGRFGLDVGRKFFTIRMLRPWHRLPRGAVAVPPLEVFKARLDGALSNLG
ncbi:hypothetical protein DUI87_17933 [Hirundo rustica rustica]|uniref:Uncharacterized protein n=1 Tax=Hirundo rustica rustica TaxID=333673 RepID=A0A3M0JX55_HIRRU|nr:hypothetical protein DUI87_17933 [Hirundo rustica rustica]